MVDIKFGPSKEKLVLVAGCSNGAILIFRPKEIFSVENWVAEFEFVASTNGITSISWSQCSYEPLMLAIGCCSKPSSDLFVIEDTHEGLVQIWWINEKAGVCERAIKDIKENHKETVNDVAWAPFMARSFHILLSCSIDCSIIFWKINPEINKEGDMVDIHIDIMNKINLELIVYT